MPKLKLSDRERQNRTLIAIIQSGKVMEGVSVEKLSKLTGIPKSTLYQRFSVPEDIRLGELREILKVLKIPEEEKERIEIVNDAPKEASEDIGDNNPEIPADI